MTKKNIWVDPILHQKLKIVSNNLSTTLGKLTNAILSKFMLNIPRKKKSAITHLESQKLRKMVKEVEILA